MPVRLSASARRRQLLDVALAAFGSAGYHDASMADIAREAGVTKPVLYQHFDSKRALYRQVVAEAGDRLIAAVDAATAGATSPRDRVEQGFAAYVTFLAHNPACDAVLFVHAPAPDLELVDDVGKVRRALASTFGALAAGDALGPAECLLIGHALVGFAGAATRQWMAAGETIPSEQLACFLSETIWAGLDARAAAPTPG